MRALRKGEGVPGRGAKAGRWSGVWKPSPGLCGVRSWIVQVLSQPVLSEAI